MEKSKGPQGGPSGKQSRLSTCVGQHCNSYYTGFTPAGKQGQQRIGPEFTSNGAKNSPYQPETK